MPEVERVAECAIEGDEIDGGEGETGLLEGFLAGWADGEEGVVRGEGSDAVVLGRVGKGEGAAG